MKNLVATFDSKRDAWYALTELTRRNVMGRHAMRMEALDANNSDGRTRLIVSPKLGSEAKAAKAVLKEFKPLELGTESAKR